MAVHQAVDRQEPISEQLRSSAERAAHTLDLNEWALLETVLRALDHDPVLDVSDVDIEIDGRRVILVGSVPGPTTKARIEQTIARIDGVSTIDNRLVVGAPRRG